MAAMKIPKPEQLDSASRGLRVIAHPVRLQILCNLINQAMNVSELIEQTGISQPVLSQHLARLRDLHIVNCTRQGKLVFYQLADPAYSSIIAAVKAVYCQEAGNVNGGAH
jgi:DNA-binding transcriptional ArsR family regulator